MGRPAANPPTTGEGKNAKLGQAPVLHLRTAPRCLTPVVRFVALY